MSSRKRGPPTTDIPTNNKFIARDFGVRNTGVRSSDLSAVGVGLGAGGIPARRRGTTQTVAESTRAASIASIMNQQGAMAYNKAITQTPDEEFQPRVFHAKHVVESLLRATDANTDYMMMFYRMRRRKPHAEVKHTNLAPASAAPASNYRSGFPLEGVEALTIPEINYEFASERKIVGNGRYPSPQAVMKDLVLWGPQNNQVGGREVGGTNAGFSSAKQVNCIIFGDADGYNIWPESPSDQDVLYFVVTRMSRAELAAAGRNVFVLDPSTGTVRRPGDFGGHRGRRKEPPTDLVENVLVIYPATSKGGGVPEVPESYDDNGYYVTPYFIKVGRYSYPHTQAKGDFNPLAATTSLREVLKAGRINFSMVPVVH